MILITILMLIVFGKLIGFAFRAAWGITKIFFGLIFLPVILIAMVIGGLIYIALPILAIVGIVLLIKKFIGLSQDEPMVY